MADSDQMFGNLPPLRRPGQGPLPGSPPRPQLPPSRGGRQDLMPVNPGEVVSGLQNLVAQYAGQGVSYIGGHPAPLPSTAYWVQPPSIQESANRLGRDVQARLEQSPEGPSFPKASTLAAAPHVLPVMATGWAPAAWKTMSKLGEQYPARAGFIDQLAKMTPEEAQAAHAADPFRGGYTADGTPADNVIRDDVLGAHGKDLALVGMAQQGNPAANRALRLMRSQPVDPLPPPPSLEDRLYGNAPGPWAQPASTPWDTFGLEQPNMPPFSANDPRSIPPPAPPSPWPPGMTLNSLPRDQQF